VAVFNVAGEFFATDDVCTHGQSSLSEGYVEADCSVECVAHMARFSLRTGEVLAPPATIPLPVYPARVDGDEVMVQLDG
jgi:3-phenylpropionate/trans-cinnamate dioxygenase ferredoxin subunit